jgi:hypothetical protein
MGRYKLRLRQGLGPRIDPHFDAAIGRVVAAQEADDKVHPGQQVTLSSFPGPAGHLRLNT